MVFIKKPLALMVLFVSSEVNFKKFSGVFSNFVFLFINFPFLFERFFEKSCALVYRRRGSLFNRIYGHILKELCFSLHSFSNTTNSGDNLLVMFSNDSSNSIYKILGVIGICGFSYFLYKSRIFYMQKLPKVEKRTEINPECPLGKYFERLRIIDKLERDSNNVSFYDRGHWKIIDYEHLRLYEAQLTRDTWRAFRVFDRIMPPPPDIKSYSSYETKEALELMERTLKIIGER